MPARLDALRLAAPVAILTLLHLLPVASTLLTRRAGLSTAGAVVLLLHGPSATLGVGHAGLIGFDSSGDRPRVRREP